MEEVLLKDAGYECRQAAVARGFQGHSFARLIHSTKIQRQSCRRAYVGTENPIVSEVGIPARNSYMPTQVDWRGTITTAMRS